MKTCGQCSAKYPDALEFCPRDGNKLPPIPGHTQAMFDPLIGSTIDGRYAVEAILGEGGMGFVYAARHVIIDKRVALKILRREAAEDNATAQRFIDEARAASKIGHQNIVDITDFGMLPDGHAYFVMEFLNGPTLAQLVVNEKQLAFPRAIEITVQIARGLYAAHQKGIIHRDLKPENIFVLERDSQRDLVKIVDFGIAKDTLANKKLTQVGMVLGTPEYMSPEQATGQDTDHRVDMYALGCILYEMVTGTVPFKKENSPKTLVAHVIEAVEPPSKKRADLPPALEKLIMRALEKKREDRFADLREMMQALDQVDASIRVVKPSTQERTVTIAASDRDNDFESSSGTDMISRRRPRKVIGIAVVISVALIGSAAIFRGQRNSEPAAPAAAAKPAAPAPAVAPTPIAAPVAAPTPPAPVGVATIAFSTKPAGAEVILNGVLRARTPDAITVPMGSTELEFIIKHNGYQSVMRRVVPDRPSQQLFLSLEKSAHHEHAPAQIASPPPQKSPSPNKATTTGELRNPFE